MLLFSFSLFALFMMLLDLRFPKMLYLSEIRLLFIWMVEF
jgi:hypothetical protein